MIVLVLVYAIASPLAQGVGTRTVGVDFGLRRVGVALSTGFAPQPLTVIRCNGSHADFARVAKQISSIALAEHALQIVLGLPFNSLGGEGEQAVVTRQFGGSLTRESPLPVFLWDERFSSAEAAIRMHGGHGAIQGEAVDAVAAAVILEEFFAGAYETAEHIAAPEKISADGRAFAPSNDEPPASSYSDIRRRMHERVAQQQRAALLQRPEKGGAQRMPKSRRPSK